MIRVSDLDVAYDGVAVLQDVSLTVSDGEIVTVVGPSGCGKTTLLRAVAGLTDPDSGKVRVDGHPPDRARARADIGFVFQDDALLPWRSAIENVTFLREMAERDPDREGARALLERIGLGDAARKRPGELSGGMRGRVALARALHLNPSVLLMDEPFGALDELTREELNALFLQMWRQRRQTVLFVTHSVPEAVWLADRCVVLAGDPGTVVERVPVDLPRPRGPDTLTTVPFQQRVRAVREELFGSGTET